MPENTKLRQHLIDDERSVRWLARQLGVAHQTALPWVNGSEKTPRGRQAQILIFLGLTGRQAEFFDPEGRAR